MTRLASSHPRIASFLGNPYTPEHRLIRYLLAGFIVGGASIYGFIGLFDELREVDELEIFDRTLASAISDHALPAAVTWFGGITWLGHWGVLTSAGVVVAAVLLARRRTVLFVAWTGALIGGGLLNLALKAAIQRGRPELAAAIHAGGWSFPSGHAMGATTAYGMLAYLVALRYREHPGPVVAAAVLIILLIGASRMYLGVHYFSDVAGGFLAGAGWLAICISACERAMGRQVTSAGARP